MASQSDKQRIFKDQIYRKQEAEIKQQKDIIEVLKDQLNEYNYINDDTEKKFSSLNDKYLLKKQKMKDLKNRMKQDYLDM